MFNELAELMSDRDITTLTLTKLNGKMSVSVMPTKTGLKDEAKGKLSPIIVSGTPDELDAEFIQAICQPLTKATGLLTNMDTFEKSIEAAEAASKATTEAKKKEEKEGKAFSEKMKKVETFNEKKYAEAAILLKTATEMPTADAKQCEVLKNKISVELNSGTLFA